MAIGDIELCLPIQTSASRKCINSASLFQRWTSGHIQADSCIFDAKLTSLICSEIGHVSPGILIYKYAILRNFVENME